MADRSDRRVAVSERPFDWRRDCPDDVARAFRPVAGRGRGKEVTIEAVKAARRKLRDRGLTSPPTST